jgi:tRNA(fMet)-specific endonuclease VapC
MKPSVWDKNGANLPSKHPQCTFLTPTILVIQRNGEDGKRILARLAAISDPEVAVTVITYEEQVKGRLSVLARAKTLDKQKLAHQAFQQVAIDYLKIAILPFSYAAALEHQRLRKAYPRLGNMDLKIAEISLTSDAILLTRNKSDFGEIIELRIEDWSRL